MHINKPMMIENRIHHKSVFGLCLNNMLDMEIGRNLMFWFISPPRFLI